MDVAVLVSPAAGRGRARASSTAVLRALEAAGLTPRVLPAVTGPDAERQAAEAIAGGAGALVAIGGDGSAHAALQAVAGTTTPLAVIPAGTGNDLARALSVPAEPLAAADATATALRVGRVRPLDLGRVAGGSWFATVLCAGFDSAVNERANRLRWPRGPHRYDVAILAELTKLRPYPLLVETDTDTVRLDATMVSLGNLPYYGGGIPICPAARPDDGLLDITVVGATSRRDLVTILPRLRTGRHVDHPAVSTLRARSVHLSGENHWVAYADGERQARLPLTVRCVPAVLSVVDPN